jgi:AraC-like DNA-binding protein
MKAVSRMDFVRWAQITPFPDYTLARLRNDFSQVSRRQLYRYFREFFGQTPQQWLNGLKIARASRLLLELRCVKAAADDLGFKQRSHFSRVFKALAGISPAQFISGIVATGGEPCRPPKTNIQDIS